MRDAIRGRSWQTSSRTPRGFVATSIFLCSLVAFSACAPSVSSASHSPSSASSTKERLSLKVALGAALATNAWFWIPLTLGYFNDEALDVEGKNVGVNVVTALASGQADIGSIGTPNALTPVKNGVETSIIYNTTDAIGAGFVFGQKTISSIQECKRVAALGGASSGITWASIMMRQFSAKYDIVPFTDQSTLQASMAAGAVDCAVGSYPNFSPLLKDGRVHVVLDPRDSSKLPAGFPRNVSAGAYFGITDNLKAKREAVVRFLRATDRALHDVIMKQTPQQLAAILKKDSNFQAQSEADLAEQIGVVRDYYAPLNGYLPASLWPATVQFYKDGGPSLGLESMDVAVPQWSYERRVDMSYFETAIGKPTAP